MRLPSASYSHSRLHAEDDPAGGEVRALDDVRQLVGRDVWVVDELDDRVADLAQVVGRDVGRQADADAGGAVDQQVGQRAGSGFGSFEAVVEVGEEVDRVLVDVGEHLLGDGGQPRFRVAHGRRRVVVDAAEVALAVDQRVAQREVLGQADQRVVDRAVAVGVVVFITSPTMAALLR